MGPTFRHLLSIMAISLMIALFLTPLHAFANDKIRSPKGSTIATGIGLQPAVPLVYTMTSEKNVKNQFSFSLLIPRHQNKTIQLANLQSTWGGITLGVSKETLWERSNWFHRYGLVLYSYYFKIQVSKPFTPDHPAQTITSQNYLWLMNLPLCIGSQLSVTSAFFIKWEIGIMLPLSHYNASITNSDKSKVATDIARAQANVARQIGIFPFFNLLFGWNTND